VGSPQGNRPEEQAASGDRAAQRSVRPWLEVIVPPDVEACEAVRELLTDTRVRVNEISECIAFDPVLTIEILKTANSVSHSTSQIVTSLRQGITSLGVNTISDVIGLTQARPRPAHPEISEHIETLRSRARDISAIAAIVAGQAAREKVDTCATTGLLATIGDMVVALFLKERYLEIAKQFTRRTQIVYRLVKDFQLDPDTVRVEFLRQQGIPSELYSAFVEDGGANSESAARIRMIVLSAIELVDAQEGEKFGNYEPGKKIPPKSQLRMLQLNDMQYAAMYEQVKRYFASGELNVPVEEEEAAATVATPPIVAPIDMRSEAPQEPPQDEPPPPVEVVIETEASSPILVVAPAEPETAPVEVPVSKIENAVETISSILSSATSKEELLETLLETLIAQGHFARTALLAINRSERQAVAIASCGSDSSALERLAINDPLSPLLQSLSKVQSCSRVGGGSSPFGSPTFALAPVDAGTEGPVVLYADCGHGAKISLAARRIFRHVVERLNELLPTLPGNIQS